MKNPIQDFPGYMLRVISHRLHYRLSNKIAVYGVRISDASVLVLIKENPGLTQSQIGQGLDIARANMAPMIAKLEKLGYITKQRLDGRSYGLFLSDAGLKAVDQIMSEMKSHEAYILETFEGREEEDFMSYLKRLHAKTQ